MLPGSTDDECEIVGYQGKLHRGARTCATNYAVAPTCRVAGAGLTGNRMTRVTKVRRLPWLGALADFAFGQHRGDTLWVIVYQLRGAKPLILAPPSPFQ